MLEALLMLGLIFLVLASLHDLKTREVPDYLSYAFICIAIIVQLYYTLITRNYQHGMLVLLSCVAATIFSVLMYKARQWGGADAKLTIALSLCLTNPDNPWLFAQYFIHFLVVGALYGTLGSLILILKERKKFGGIVKEELERTKAYYATAAIILAAGGVLVLFNNLLGGIMMVTGGLALFSLVLNNANKLMIKTIPLSKLTEGDWIVEKVIAGRKVLFNPEKEIDVKQEQITQMKKARVKKVKIIEGIPFIPSFLIAYVITMVNPELFLNVIKGLTF
jgi:Flp pilus assembly protein protease CpaA